MSRGFLPDNQPIPPGTGPPGKPKPPGNQGTVFNPALITSTGGLQGLTGAMMTPVIVTTIPKQSSFVMIHDPSNFDCEEDAIYFFRQEVISPFEGQSVQINRAIIKYRELDYAQFFIGFTAYQQKSDDFITLETPVSIPPITLKGNRLSRFPDKRIHIISIEPPKGIIQGINPQVYIRREKNSGPLSITKLILCTFYDEMPQV